MFGLLSIVGIAAVLAASLMVAVMLYIVWLAMDDETHEPSPDDGERPELGADGRSTVEEDDPQGGQPEVPDGSSA
jgi:hypothetical protein